MDSSRKPRLYVPKDLLRGSYTAELSLEAGEKTLVKFSEKLRFEYQWVFYPDPDRWAFYPQVPSEEKGEDSLKLATQLFPLIARNLHVKGNPIVYHLHPKYMADFLKDGLRRLGHYPRKCARNMGMVLTMFPSDEDLDECNERWRISDNQQQREFGIASPTGILRIRLQSNDEAFFKSYNSSLQSEVIKGFKEKIAKSRDLESLIPEIIEEHNRRFDGSLSLAYKPASTQ